MSKLPFRVYLKNYYPNWFYRRVRATRDKKLIDIWKNNGCEIPAVDAYKRKLLAEIVKLNNRNIFIETGTFLGDTVFDIYPLVDKVITIEVSKELKNNAAKRFAGNSKVEILEGDSAKVISTINTDNLLKDRVIFWLDGHYSGGYTGIGEEVTPIYKELEGIKTFAEKGIDCIVLIDDKRLFNGTDGYPLSANLKAEIEKLYDVATLEFHDFFVFSFNSQKVVFPEEAL